MGGTWASSVEPGRPPTHRRLPPDPVDKVRDPGVDARVVLVRAAHPVGDDADDGAAGGGGLSGGRVEGRQGAAAVALWDCEKEDFYCESNKIRTSLSLRFMHVKY